MPCRAKLLLLVNLLFLSLLGIVQEVSAQIDLTLGQYPILKSYYNPSIIADSQDLNLVLAHNRQFQGVEDASQSFVLMADMPFNFLGGVYNGGISLQNHSIGLFKDNELTGLVAKKFVLSNNFSLNIGLGISLRSSVFEGNKVYIPQGGKDMSKTDEAIPTTEVSGRGFDAQFGIGLDYKKISFALGLRNLLALPMVLGTEYERETSRSYNLFLGYNFSIENTLIECKPSIFATLNEQLLYRVDTRLDLLYHKRFHLGVMYRVNNAWGLALGLKFGKVSLHYQFEYPTSELSRGTFGTHEVVLKYSLPINLNKTKKGNYKSIRLL